MLSKKSIVAFVMSILLVTTSSSYAFAASNNVLKDSDGTIHGPQIGEQNGKPVYESLDTNMSASEKEWMAKKDAIVNAHSQYKDNEISKPEYIQKLKSLGVDQATLNAAQRPATPSKLVDSSLLSPDSTSATSNYIYDLYQQPQQTSYWCGPATASEIIQARIGGTYSQSSLVASLHCTLDGSPWYDGTYPMRDTLNNRIGINWYVPYGTSVDANEFKSRVLTDIDTDYAVAGNAWEVVGGPHLTGHPNQVIYHWFAIDGYADSGNSIHYADSVHGASSISWSASVPAYSSINYQTMATIVDGRGIIW